MDENYILYEEDERLKINWENKEKNLCVMCDTSLSSSSFWYCKKCKKPCDIIQRQLFGDVMEIKSECCKRDIINNQKITCSNSCHTDMVRQMEKDYGEFKKIIDVKTNTAHRVPTKVIIEEGLDYEDLGNYPLW